MEVRAVKDYIYTAKKQWMSGYHLGYEKVETWRFSITMAGYVM